MKRLTLQVLALVLMFGLTMLTGLPRSLAQVAGQLEPTASDSRMVFVSPTGNDTSDGSSGTEAVQSADRAVSLLRRGEPDWLNLQRGHTYTLTQVIDQLSGTSADMPMVINAYGIGDAPTLDVGPNADKFSAQALEDNHVRTQGVTLKGLDAQFPVLQPGSGWNGPTAQPDAIGAAGMAGYDAKAIARWDVVPYQSFDGKLHIGVVAFHMNGIERVAFSVEGGPWVDVHTMQTNPRTDVEEYTVTVDAQSFPSSGLVEVRAIVYPKVGVPRVLSGPYAFENAYQNAQWVGEHAMFLHADVAGDNTDLVVEIPSGTYAWGGLPGVPTDYPTDRWLIIRPQAGADVTITSGLWHPQPNMIRLQGLKIHQPAREAVLRGSTDNIVWFDGVDYIGPGMWVETDPMKMVHSYWTNSSVTESQYGHAQHLIRNCQFSKIGEDTIKAAYLVLNTTVRNEGTPPAGLGWHPAVIGNPMYHDNRIYFGMDIKGRQKAFAFRNGTQDHWEHTDVALVNCRAEKTTTGNQLFYLGGQTNHMLIEDCTFLGVDESWNYRLSTSLTIPEWRFTPHNVVLRNNNWYDKPDWLPNPSPLAGVKIYPIGQDAPSN